MIAYVGLILFQIPGCIGFRVFSPSKVSASSLYISFSSLALPFDESFLV